MRFVFVFLLFITGVLSAQTPQPVAPVGKATWRCELPGGIYEAAIPAMVSVSSHEYIVDGAARVTEVNVDTQGSISARFYYLEPITNSAPGGLGAATLEKAQSIIAEAAERTGSDVWKKVVKSYPATTHSKTVEYRLTNKDSVKKLVDSASKAMKSGQSDKLSLSE